jgi:class 3 adenylate cyclase
VNLSARVCDIAEGGQILVTNRVLAAIEDRVDARALGDIDFKGIARPVPTFEVVSVV